MKLPRLAAYVYVGISSLFLAVVEITIGLQQQLIVRPIPPLIHCLLLASVLRRQRALIVGLGTLSWIVALTIVTFHVV